MIKASLVLGAVLGGTSVGLGAFAAHALKGKLGASSLAAFETGVRYQMYHALALIAVGLLASRLGEPGVRALVWLFGGGTLLFSGSLYALTTLGISKLGIVTPIGGLLLIGGWIVLAVRLLSSPA